MRLLEQLATFPAERIRPILEKMSSDPDPDIRAEASERLSLLG